MPAKRKRNHAQMAPIKKNTYEEFILWSAMPSFEQKNFGIETQKAFAEYYKINMGTISRWKGTDDYIKRVTEIRKQWAFQRTSDVIAGVYRSCVKGNPHSQKLWFQYFMGMTDKVDVSVQQKIEISVNDIRHLIEILPEELKQKHYANLRELLDDASAARNAGSIEEGHWSERPADPVQPEADNDAQDVSEPAQDAMAARHPSSLRPDLVGPVLPRYYQGAERWR